MEPKLLLHLLLVFVSPSPSDRVHLPSSCLPQIKSFSISFRIAPSIEKETHEKSLKALISLSRPLCCVLHRAALPHRRLLLVGATHPTLFLSPLFVVELYGVVAPNSFPCLRLSLLRCYSRRHCGR